GGPTATNTPTSTPLGSTPTNTPTFAIPIPVFQHNFGTTAAPNGIVILGNSLTAAEYDSNVGPMVENFTIAAANNGTVNVAPGIGLNNFVWTTFPVPNTAPTPQYNPLPAWTPVATGLNAPQGFVNQTTGTIYSSTLDAQSGGGAILYYGTIATIGWQAGPTGYGLGYVYQPYTNTGFDSKGFNNPKGMGADSAGNVYIADTGNGRIEQFNGNGPFHSWTGNAGNAIANAGGIPFTTVAFKSPYAVVCDTNSPATVYVADNGYNPPVVQMFSAGGTTITGGFTTVVGGTIHGLAVSSIAPYNIYVADYGLGQIEIYSQTGNLLGVITDPHGYAEAGTFTPNCLAFDANGYIWAGDAINEQIVSFK
ncbi:MAG TPA: hypothetical protein VN963_00245, partial [bacterium]|nr:hypothetical protein [bacterium]